MRILIFGTILFLTTLGYANQPNPKDLVTAPSDDPRLIYTYKPNTKGTNSRGYFDKERPYEKKNGIYRIVVIGDSIAQGQDVRRRKSFPKVLEKRLNPSFKKKYEVVVLARTGYSTSQEMVLFEEEAFLYDPDLIIWSYVLNDPAHPVFHDANGKLGEYHYKHKNKVKHMIEKKQFILEEKWRGKNCPREYHAFLQCAYWDQIVADVKKIAMLSQAKKVPLIFLIHPVFQKERNFHQYTLTREHNKLAGLASQEGLIPLDLLNDYKPHDPNDIKLHSQDPKHFDPWHPNSKGHLIVAEKLLKVIVEMRDSEGI